MTYYIAFISLIAGSLLGLLYGWAIIQQLLAIKKLPFSSTRSLLLFKLSPPLRMVLCAIAFYFLLQQTFIQPILLIVSFFIMLWTLVLYKKA
jgi:hypothetical protein